VEQVIHKLHSLYKYEIKLDNTLNVFIVYRFNSTFH